MTSVNKNTIITPSLGHVNTSITAAPSLNVRLGLLEIANKVALQYAMSHSSSSWHPWNVIDQHPEHIVDQYKTGRNFWDQTGNFGSCLGVATHIVSSLRNQLRNGLDCDIHRRPYAHTVQLMTCAKRANSETGYHAIVAMCFNEFAIVIDHAIHPTALVIPVGEGVYTSPCIPLLGAKCQTRFKYYRDGTRFKLSMDDGNEHKAPTFEPLFFSVMDLDLATSMLAIPSALQTIQIEGQEHVYMPPRKYISVRSLLDEDPEFIAAQPVNGRWLATTLRMQIDFANARISIQIPNADWLMKKQGMHIANSFMTLPEGLKLIQTTDATLLLQVDFDAKIHPEPMMDEQPLAFMWELCGQFGLREDDLEDIVESLYRVWTPYRPQVPPYQSAIGDLMDDESERADSVIGGDMDESQHVGSIAADEHSGDETRVVSVPNGEFAGFLYQADKW